MGLADLPESSVPIYDSSDSDYVTADEYRSLFRKKRALRGRSAKARHVRARMRADSAVKVEVAESECTCEHVSHDIFHSEI